MRRAALALAPGLALRSLDLSSPELGRLGEQLAARRLRRGGARPVGRRLRTAAGELDLALLEGRGREATLVVVEVKTRRLPRGEKLRWRPRDAVDAAAVERLAFASARLARSLGCGRWRVDLAEVLVRDPGRTVEIELTAGLAESGRPRGPDRTSLPGFRRPTD